MTFVDTNYFLRFLLKDNSAMHSEAKELFVRGATGKEELFTSTIVIFEIYWVMSSFYGKNRAELIKILGDILRMSFVKLSERETISLALAQMEKLGFDLEDSFNLVYAKHNGAKVFASFDKKLKKHF